jgi:hypothetical protein
MMLERAGFTSVEVRGEYNDLEPTPEDDFLVYLAHAWVKPTAKPTARTLTKRPHLPRSAVPVMS